MSGRGRSLPGAGLRVLCVLLAAALAAEVRRRARSLAVRWRRPGPRPQIPPHPRPAILGPGGPALDVPLPGGPVPGVPVPDGSLAPLPVPPRRVPGVRVSGTLPSPGEQTLTGLWQVGGRLYLTAPRTWPPVVVPELARG